ncbi:MAG: hypothetical protein PHR61_02230 [Candidatus Absconditabacteria bacterium]|nr:hypothetical protein [Candidatus Absconditabacteria bacterium]
METPSNGLKYLSENTLTEIKKKFSNQWKNIYYSLSPEYKGNYLSKLDDFFCDFFYTIKNKTGEERNNNNYFYNTYKKCFEKKGLPNGIKKDLFEITSTVGNLRKKEIKEEINQKLKENLDIKRKKTEEENRKTKELLSINLSDKEKEFFRRAIEKNEKINTKRFGLRFVIKNIGEEKYFIYLKKFFDKLLKNKETGKKREIFIKQIANEIFGNINRIDNELLAFLKRFFKLYKDHIDRNPPGQTELF